MRWRPPWCVRASASGEEASPADSSTRLASPTAGRRRWCPRIGGDPLPRHQQPDQALHRRSRVRGGARPGRQGQRGLDVRRRLPRSEKRLDREGTLTPEQLASVRSGFLRDWDWFLKICVLKRVYERAGELTELHALRGFDAIHLASFLEVLGQADVEDVEFRLRRPARGSRESGGCGADELTP